MQPTIAAPAPATKQRRSIIPQPRTTLPCLRSRSGQLDDIAFDSDHETQIDIVVGAAGFRVIRLELYELAARGIDGSNTPSLGAQQALALNCSTNCDLRLDIAATNTRRNGPVSPAKSSTKKSGLAKRGRTLA